MKSYGVTIQMKATEQYFPVVLFIMLYKVVLTFESVDEILRSYPSDESYWAVLSFGTAIILYKVVLSLITWMRSAERYFPVVLTVYYDELAGFDI